MAEHLGRLGSYFAVATHAPAAVPAAPWALLSELANQPDAVHDRVLRTRSALSARDPDHPVALRVAASVTHLGLVARVLAPVVGLTVMGFDGTALLAGHGWWQDTLGGPFPLSIPDPPRHQGALSLDGSWVASVSTAISLSYAVSPHVIWGNVASAAQSAASMVAVARPELYGPAAGAIASLLDDPRVDVAEQHPSMPFRRHSCCLIYWVSGSRAAVCGDCVLGA